MADYIQSLEDMYSKMYKSKEQQALQKKQEGLSQLDTQQSALSNQYQELQNALNARKQTTQAQYQGLYTNLNNQQEEGKETYYNDRNNAAVGNVQRVQQIRDYMAKNNLMSSGENPDAMMRATTDYMNEKGNIYNNEQKFNRGIADKRNQYSLEEQGAYQGIDNELTASEREKAQKIAEILNNRKQVEDSTLSELSAYRDELEAKKTGDINTYNERLRQEELQRQEAEAQYQRQLAMQREQQAASLKAAQASAARSNANSQASAQQKAQQAAQKALNDQYNKYLQRGYSMIDSTTEAENGGKVSKYNNTSMYNWVSNLDLPGEYKAQLLNDLGVSKPQAEAYTTNPYYSSGSVWKYSGGR